jgi:hypothetical protein
MFIFILFFCDHALTLPKANGGFIFVNKILCHYINIVNTLTLNCLKKFVRNPCMMKVYNRFGILKLLS